MEGGKQGIVGTPMQSGRCERSLQCLRRTGRRGCGFAECALGDRRRHGRCAAVRRAEAHHTRHHRRLEPPRAAACHTHISLECRLHRTAPRDPRVGSTQRRAMRQRQGVHLQPLSDGQRHIILGIIDVWSRRVLLHVARTSPSTAVCTALRRAILAWGVPNVVRCDNGKEFISNHTRAALTNLGIAQETAPPFQPERKPFIKRALGTFFTTCLRFCRAFAATM